MNESTITAGDPIATPRPPVTALVGRPIAVRWWRGYSIIWPFVVMLLFCWSAMVVDHEGYSRLAKLLASLTMSLFVLEIPVVSSYIAKARAWRAQESGGVPCLRCGRDMVVDGDWCRCERCDERVRREFAALVWLDVHEKARSVGGVPATRVIDTTDYRTPVKVLTVLAASLVGVLIGIAVASATTGEPYIFWMFVTGFVAGFLGWLAYGLSRNPQLPGKWRCAECGYLLNQRLYERCPECGVRNFLSEESAARHRSTPWRRELESLLKRQITLVVLVAASAGAAHFMVHYRAHSQHLRWIVEDGRAEQNTTESATTRRVLARFERAYDNSTSSLRWWAAASVVSLILCGPLFVTYYREADRVRLRRDAYARGEFEYPAGV